MEAIAKLRNYPCSERKMRLVAELVRKKSVDDALNILKLNNKAASDALSKLLVSAISNWENKTDFMHDAADYDLRITELLVDQGPFLKRFRPAAQGRAHRIRKRTCHVSLRIENTLPLEDENGAVEEVAEEGEIQEEITQ